MSGYLNQWRSSQGCNIPSHTVNYPLRDSAGITVVIGAEACRQNDAHQQFVDYDGMIWIYIAWMNISYQISGIWKLKLSR
jgi:hypothetical protein